MDAGSLGKGSDVLSDAGRDDELPALGIEQFSGAGYRGCRLAGEIDFTCAGPVQATLTALVLPGGGTVVVDLTRVTFIDSSGLGVLVQAHRNSLEQATRLLVVTSPPVAKLLRITALDEVLETYENLAAAEAAVVSAGGR